VTVGRSSSRILSAVNIKTLLTFASIIGLWGENYFGEPITASAKMSVENCKVLCFHVRLAASAGQAAADFVCWRRHFLDLLLKRLKAVTLGVSSLRLIK